MPKKNKVTQQARIGKSQKWKDHGFTDQEIQEWIQIGLSIDEFDLACYLKYKNYDPTILPKNLDKLRSEHCHAQTYLDFHYPKDKRKEITKLDISNRNLTGSLRLEDFNNLERFYCSNNQLVDLEINCSQLVEFLCSHNKLTSLDFLVSLVNLERLDIDHNPLADSLELLKTLTKLKVLDIRDTNIGTGLEYLPNGLEIFLCGNSLLAKELSSPYWEISEYDNYLPLLQKWWKDNQTLVQEAKEIKIKGKFWDRSSDSSSEESNQFSIQELENSDSEASLKKEFEKNKQKISTLKKEKEITKLTKLIEKQKEKIIEVPISLIFEEELKRKLVNAYSKYIKAKKQRLPSAKYEEEYYEIKKEIRNKLGEEDIEKIQLILTDYEDLINLELELESKKLLMEEITEQQAQIQLPPKSNQPN